MPYIVRASMQACEKNWSYAEANDAAEKVTKLLAEGVREVKVEAPGGRSYRDDELDRMLAIAELTDKGRT